MYESLSSTEADTTGDTTDAGATEIRRSEHPLPVAAEGARIAMQGRLAPTPHR